jgi:ABC-type sugar transport system ATPase subunit
LPADLRSLQSGRYASQIVLEARGFRAGGFSKIDLKIHAGEILELGGLASSGRTEIAGVLFGVELLIEHFG